MSFKLKRTVKSYAAFENHIHAIEVEEHKEGQVVGNLVPRSELEVPSKSTIIWKGTVKEYRSILIIREAELIVAQSKLIGNPQIDWWARNHILVLEKQIANLKEWLTEALEKEEGD